jgi:phage terminase Nu1 subunit (DNA packaging protein)
MPLISKAELAVIRGVSPQTVQGWKRRGFLVMRDGKVDQEPTELRLAQRPPLGRRDKPRDDETPEAFVNRTVIDGGNAPWSIKEAQRIRENAVAMLRQIEVDRERGKVVLVEDIAQALTAEFHVLRNGILSLGARLAPRLMKQCDPNVIKKIIYDEAVALLTELTTRSEQCLKSKSTSESGRA